MDKHGDSEGNYILLAMVEDDEGVCPETQMAFLTVGNFKYDPTATGDDAGIPVKS
jgi:hypothetical protein